MRKRRMPDSSISSEKPVGMQFEKASTTTIERPQRNLARPETKDMQVLGEISRGAKNFERIQKITELERNELVSILDDLEKRGLMRVEQKSGLMGPKVELHITDKGFQEYFA